MTHLYAWSWRSSRTPGFWWKVGDRDSHSGPRRAVGVQTPATEQAISEATSRLADTSENRLGHTWQLYEQHNVRRWQMWNDGAQQQGYNSWQWSRAYSDPSRQGWDHCGLASGHSCFFWMVNDLHSPTVLRTCLAPLECRQADREPLCTCLHGRVCVGRKLDTGPLPKERQPSARASKFLDLCWPPPHVRTNRNLGVATSRPSHHQLNRNQMLGQCRLQVFSSRQTSSVAAAHCDR